MSAHARDLIAANQAGEALISGTVRENFRAPRQSDSRIAIDVRLLRSPSFRRGDLGWMRPGSSYLPPGYRSFFLSLFFIFYALEIDLA